MTREGSPGKRKLFSSLSPEIAIPGSTTREEEKIRGGRRESEKELEERREIAGVEPWRI